MRISRPEDLAEVSGSGKVGIMLTFQNADHFRGPDDVSLFHQLGQRITQLTYNYASPFGSGFMEHRDGGLTVAGGAIVERMNKVGMAIDSSHSGDITTLDILAASEKPVVFTHASCRALLPGHLRCKTDEMIRKLARSGGVMGVPFLRFLIRDKEPVTIEHVLDHFDHIARLVGIEHAAIGSDMDLEGFGKPRGAPDQDAPPQPERPNFERYQLHLDEHELEHIHGLDHPKRVYDLTEGLIRRGYSDGDIRLVLGGNAVRVLSNIWQA